MVLAGSGASLAAPPAEAASLVAHHSGARFVAGVRSLDQQLSTFEFSESAISDALTTADQTIGPNGRPMTLDERMEDMLRRHGLDSPNARAHAQRVPYLRQAVRRTLEICRSLDKRRTGRFNGAVDRLTLP